MFWLNIADTASGSGGAGGDYNSGGKQHGRPKWKQGDSGLPSMTWCGVPDRVRLMLQNGTPSGLSETDAAWLAGLIDADGCLHVQRNGNSFSPAITIGIIDLDVLEHVRDITGIGTVRVKHNPATHKGGMSTKVIYSWMSQGRSLKLLLRDIYPFMRIKKTQAQVLYALADSLHPAGYNVKLTDNQVQQKELWHEMVKGLNQRTWVEDVSLPAVPDPERTHQWLCRSDITWNKQRLRPESLSHARRPGVQTERIYMFAKHRDHVFYPDGLIEKGNIWSFPPEKKAKSHLAPFPIELPTRCLLCSTQPGDRILDPFIGKGTTIEAAESHGRIGYGLDLYSGDYE